MILQTLKSLLKDGTAARTDGMPDRQTACAALMVEAALADGGIDDRERKVLQERLAAGFDLSNDEADALIAQSVEDARDRTHLLRFTRAVKEQMPHEERLALMELLWEVVLADGVLDPYEDQLLRRIAGLIYVTDQERGLARRRAEARRAG